MSDPYDPLIITPDDLPACGRWTALVPGCRTPRPVYASTEHLARFTAEHGEALARLVFGCAVHRKPIDYIGADMGAR